MNMHFYMPTQSVPSVLCAYVLVCAVSVTSSGSRSAKEKQKGSTWVMTWNTASWLGGRMTFCLSLYVCPSVFLFLSVSVCLAVCLLLSYSLSSMTFQRHLICVKKPAGDYPCRSQWRDLLQPLWNVYWHSVNCSTMPLMTVVIDSCFVWGLVLLLLDYISSTFSQSTVYRVAELLSHVPLYCTHGMCGHVHLTFNLCVSPMCIPTSSVSFLRACWYVNICVMMGFSFCCLLSIFVMGDFGWC